MVSAYNLHFDILGLIFSHLSGNDLVSVALVSKAFLNAVTPRLYHSLVFSHAQAKKYPKVASPFASLLARPMLGVHVRVCDIAVFPLYKGQPIQEFINECIRALDICPNLTRFRLVPNALPSFLLTLSRKDKLKELQISGSLTSEQAKVLISVRGLRGIRLYNASWCLMNLCPRWLSVLGSTLTNLAFVSTPDLNETILEEMLIHLPGLRGLQIRNCMKVSHSTVFKLISHTPLLETLSVTTWESPSTSTVSFASVSNLRILHLDTRNSFVPETLPILWRGIMAHVKLSNAPLSSLVLQLSHKFTLPDPMVEEIIDAHAETLTSLRFIKCYFSMSSLRMICRECRNLERLAMHVPEKDLVHFTYALAETQSLQILIDEPDPHKNHGSSGSLNHDDVRTLMRGIPTLRQIVSDFRVWRKGSGNEENLQITLERFKNPSLPSMMTFT